MTSAISGSVNMNKLGGCPHGMPAGACPICSGMGGGGGSVKRKASEMSWDQCAAIGQMLKAQKENAQMAQKANENALMNSQLLQKLSAQIAEKMTTVRNFIASTVVAPVKSAFNAVKQIAAKVFMPVANAAAKAFNAVKTAFANMAANFQQNLSKFINIMDKLTAVFGEQLKAMQKQFSDNFGKVKKKLFSFFGMVDTEMSQGDSDHDDEDKWFVKLKKLFQKPKFAEVKLNNLNKVRKKEDAITG